MFPILCPQEGCRAEVADLDSKALLSAEEYDKYITFTFNKALDEQKDVSWCPSPDCQFAFICGVGDKEEFKCPLC